MAQISTAHCTIACHTSRSAINAACVNTYTDPIRVLAHKHVNVPHAHTHIHTHTHTDEEKERQLSEKQGDREQLIPMNPQKTKQSDSDSEGSIVVYETDLL